MNPSKMTPAHYVITGIAVAVLLKSLGAPVPSLILLLSLALYFVPTVVAMQRQHGNRLAIFMLNIFGGWTIAGWIVALVWACTNNGKA